MRQHDREQRHADAELGIRGRRADQQPLDRAPGDEHRRQA